MVDVILLQEYGNNKTGEVIDEAEYPTFSLMSVKKLEGEFNPWMVEAVTVEELRKIAAKFFGNKDWRGAIIVYKEILHRLAKSDKCQFFLPRVDNTIWLGQSAYGTESFLHYGVIYPASVSQFVHGSSQHVNMTINPASLYRVFTPFHLHATVLLNLGTALFNANCGNEGVEILSYAIYTAALSQETGTQTLRSKAYFWCAKARMVSSKID